VSISSFERVNVLSVVHAKEESADEILTGSTTTASRTEPTHLLKRPR
jgi:hypothetical protein